VRYVSDWIAVMYLGEVVEYGPAEQVFQDPAHPYTRALLDAVPMLDPEAEAEREIRVISGELPSPMNIPPGCAFASRCPKVTPFCRDEKPKLVQRRPLRTEACHHAG
jgi:peptide/nickel transport system ATP-binding protein